MKKIVIFYSLEGNTKFIAENIAKKIEADILELKPNKQPPKKGIMKFLWGGKQVLSKELPELEEFNIDFLKYDTIFIGTPVWAWNYTPALSSFFNKISLKNKNIALFCCHGGGKGSTLKKIEKILIGNRIIGKIDFKDPLKHNKNKEAEKAQKWAINIVGNI